MDKQQGSSRTQIIAGVLLLAGVVVASAMVGHFESLSAKPASASAAAGLVPVARQPVSLDARDDEIAAVAWGYFERNIQPATGLVNAVDGYPSTTMWDTGSTLAAFLAAADLGLISAADEKRYIDKLLQTLETIDLFNEEAPNKVYHTKTAQMADYRNEPNASGIGVSTLDLGRLVSWLKILTNIHPRYADQAAAIIERWSFCRLVAGGQMFGLARNDGKISVLQEGRLGYEQYAARALRQLGFDMSISASYQNRHATVVEVDGVPIAADRRDASQFGAHNYVVAESYALDVLEHGLDKENEPLLDNIFKVQQRRYERTGQLTAVSEDNVDQSPYFVYNTIFTNNRSWFALTDYGEDMESLKTVSTKAALSMAYLLPERDYSKKLLDGIWQARNPAGGWYSGIYEKTQQFNKATTANTNGVVLSLMLYKKYGSLHQICRQCGSRFKLSDAYLQRVQSAEQCAADLPVRERLAATLASQRVKTWAEQGLRRAVDQVDTIVALLQTSQSHLQNAELGGAIENLSKAKSETWKVSAELPNERQALRALMPEFDRLKGVWSAGKRSSDTRKLIAAIEQTRARLQSEGMSVSADAEQ